MTSAAEGAKGKPIYWDATDFDDKGAIEKAKELSKTNGGAEVTLWKRSSDTTVFVCKITPQECSKEELQSLRWRTIEKTDEALITALTTPTGLTQQAPIVVIWERPRVAKPLVVKGLFD